MNLLPSVDERLYDIAIRLHRGENRLKTAEWLDVERPNLEKTLDSLKKRQERMLLLWFGIFMAVLKDDLLLFFG